MECNNHTAVEYTTTGAPNAELYIWSIIPQNSGNITGNTTTATVDWNPAFNGTALVTVHGYNDCGAGPPSEFLEVTVNSAPEPDITGLAEVCSTAAGVLYTTPAATENSYQWEITGGEITSGTATSEILVTWGTPGTGSLSIIEESTEGCSDTAFLEVTIFDCTGLGEEGQGKIELFPNPVEDRLTLKSNHQGGGMYTVRIVNMTGQLVYNQREDAGKGTLNMTISTADMPAGVYSVHVTSADGNLMESKFMKIR
jgi:hypothetical protein